MPASSLKCLPGGMPAVGESNFMVNVHTAGEDPTIDSTPERADRGQRQPPDANATVALWGNFGPVIIDGDSTTAVAVGFPLNSTGPITWESGGRVGRRRVIPGRQRPRQCYDGRERDGDGSKHLRQRPVRQQRCDTLLRRCPGYRYAYGQMANYYTVKPSSSNAVFTSSLWIDSISNWDFRVDVAWNSASDLNLTLVNENAYHNPTEAWASVLDVTSEGSVDLPGTHPNGTIDVNSGTGPLAGFPTAASRMCIHDRRRGAPCKCEAPDWLTAQSERILRFRRMAVDLCQII